MSNELIIRFRANALNLNELCYVIPGPTLEEKKEKIQSIPDYLKNALLSQRFYVDDLILDSTFLAMIKYFGGDTLRRMTFANPCADTLSIARNGDTLKCDDFLWMVLHLNNDTNVINAAIGLTINFQDQIIGAEPNYYAKLGSNPNDYNYDDRQTSLHANMINAPRAWDFQTGNYEVKVGIIDDGVSYQHCDLGGEKGIGFKVVGGTNYAKNESGYDFSHDADHGTSVAGIIGALSNRNCYLDKGVAGISGGWKNENIDELGCQLYGYRVTFNSQEERMQDIEKIAAAIREAATTSASGTGYGNGMNVINISIYLPEYSEALLKAINYAFEHGVSVIALRGNGAGDNNYYPACFDPSRIVSVSGSDINKNLIYSYCSYGKYLDLIAPAGTCQGNETNLVYTTTSKENNKILDYGCFGLTSAAAPHVSGVISLLFSEAIDRTNNNETGWDDLEPEDFEGMVKASALDRLPDESHPDYRTNYDDKTGWGHLQADKIFNMINDGYKISHFSTNEHLTFELISETPSDCYFYNEGRLNKHLSDGSYKVRQRKYSGIIHLPDNWVIDESNKLYVWGRSGQGANGGYDASNLNYQSRYTQVVSGTGGYKLVEGIIHNHSLDVEAITYQYEVFDMNDNFIMLAPPDNEIALNISVFGKVITDVKLNNFKKNPYNLKLFPNPTIDNLNIEFNLQIPQLVKIEIYNFFGMKINDGMADFFFEGRNTINIDLNGNLPGPYFCRIDIGGNIYTTSFIVH